MFRGVFALVVTAGCSFKLQAGAGSVDDDIVDGDASPLDAAPGDGGPIDSAIDARPDAPPDAPVPAVYESLVIPGIGTMVTSQFVPANGVTYHLRATGFVTVATGIVSDAEYWGSRAA